MFNRENFLANKKKIQYLYGQLKNVHAGNDNLQINEAFLTYSGTHWTTNKGVLLEFCIWVPQLLTISLFAFLTAKRTLPS